MRLTPAGASVRALERARNDALGAQRWSNEISGNFLDARREFNRIELLIRTETARAEAEAQRFGAEFDELMGIEQVERVMVSKNVLEVTTRPLISTHPTTGARHLIGVFRIIVYLDGSQGGVRWINLTAPRAIGDLMMQAPCVREDGSAWSAAMTEPFVDFIAERSFQVVVSLAIQFIESPDPEAFGIQWLRCWPVAREMQNAAIDTD